MFVHFCALRASGESNLTTGLSRSKKSCVPPWIILIIVEHVFQGGTDRFRVIVGEVDMAIPQEGNPKLAHAPDDPDDPEPEAVPDEDDDPDAASSHLSSK